MNIKKGIIKDLTVCYSIKKIKRYRCEFKVAENCRAPNSDVTWKKPNSDVKENS